jgi:uncharacterized protein
MSTEPLPSTLDVRKAATRGVSVSGTLKPLDLQRFRSLLAADEGEINAHLTFSRDEENRYIVRVVLDALVMVICQRCLEPMQESLVSDNTLAIVLNDDQAAHLPRHLEPLIVEGESCNLRELVEDDLILALQPFSYHDTQECKKILAGFNAREPEPEGAQTNKPNPFNVLEQLKPGKST